MQPLQYCIGPTFRIGQKILSKNLKILKKKKNLSKKERKNAIILV